MGLMRPVQALFFDLDDTLVDFSSARKRALNDIATDLAQRASHENPRGAIDARAAIVRERVERGASVTQTSNMGADRIRVWQEVLNAIGTPDLANPAELVDKHDALTCEHLRLYPDSDAAVRWAQDRFELVGIITNGASEAQWREIRAVGLDTRVQRVIVAGDVGAYKPDVRIFEAALANVKIAPIECAFVGNSPDHDVAGACAAGWQTIWLNRDSSSYPPTAPDPSVVIRSLAKIPLLFQGLR